MMLAGRLNGALLDIIKQDMALTWVQTNDILPKCDCLLPESTQSDM